MKNLALFEPDRNFCRLQTEFLVTSVIFVYPANPFFDKTFKSLNGRGFKANYYHVETNQGYWISGCKKDGTDALYPNTVEIDEDVSEEYWTSICGKPRLVNSKRPQVSAKYRK